MEEEGRRELSLEMVTRAVKVDYIGDRGMVTRNVSVSVNVERMIRRTRPVPTRHNAPGLRSGRRLQALPDGPGRATEGQR